MEMQVGRFVGGLVRERYKTNGIAVAVDRENSGREVSRDMRLEKCGCGKSLLLPVRFFETSVLFQYFLAPSRR